MGGCKQSSNKKDNTNFDRAQDINIDSKIKRKMATYTIWIHQSSHTY